MKTLYVLRHAKSSWDNPEWSDFDRPLNDRGLKTAPLMGKVIFDNQFQPDVIVSSPAERAEQTAVLVKENARVNEEIKFDERIYEASPLRLFQVISEMDEDKNSMMLVGHNPGLEGLVKILTGEIQAMPTAALAVINLNINNWKDISADCGELQTLLRPKEILKSFKED